MNMNISSKYDIGIIFVCLGILMFSSCMIIAEIQKRKNKLKYAIVNILLIMGFFLVIIAVPTFKLGYIFNFLIYISGIVILGKDIISFIIKQKHSNEKSQSIKIKCNWVGSIIIYLMITLLNKVNTPSFELVEIYMILILLADLAITYPLNHYLNLYESGIAISTFSFPKKIIPYDEIISYEDVENIHFSKGEKNKFILNIKVKNSKRRSPYEYIINARAKDEFLSFIENYVHESKITNN